MGHLDNTERVIEVRLTAVGREKLAKGEGIDITRFALSDDEINYGLLSDLPEEDREAVIESLPVLEALTDETQSMRHKLITLEGNSSNIPQISVRQEIYLRDKTTISPETVIEGNEVPLDKLIGYSAALDDSSNLELKVTEEPEKNEATIPSAYKEKFTGNSELYVGTEFEIRKVGTVPNDKQTSITFVGNETGLSGKTTINIIST